MGNQSNAHLNDLICVKYCFVLNSYRFVDKVSEGLIDIEATFSLWK